MGNEGVWEFMLKKQIKEKLMNRNYAFSIGEDIYGRFRFPFEKVRAGSKIILYGGGVVGKTFLKQIEKSSHCVILAICDQNPMGTNIVEVPIISVAQLSGMDEDSYDFVVIAIESKNIADRIWEDLCLAGVEEKKIIWMNPSVCGGTFMQFRNLRSIEQKEGASNGLSKEIMHMNLLHPQKTWLKSKDSIFMDTTRITINDWGGGIQRTVNNLYQRMLELGGNVIPVRYTYDRDDFITSRKYKCRMEGTVFDDIEYSLSMSKQDTLLFTDSSWDFEDRLLVKANESGVRISTLIYDLIPIRLTDSHNKNVRAVFKKWIHAALQYSNSIICITKTVADDVIQYYRENQYERETPLDLYVIHLGCEIESSTYPPREEIRDFVEGYTVFLMVGTVETRKNHALALEAFRNIYNEDPNKKIRLLILGKKGWMVDEFQKMYRENSLLKGRVLWVQNASDGEVQWAYRHCSALIYPPKIEGLGLPLLEAAHFNLPILCSDIPVFREVVKEYGNYFRVNDSEALRKAILEWLSSREHPESKLIRRYRWKDTAKEVLDILHGRVNPYYRIKGKIK